VLDRGSGYYGPGYSASLGAVYRLNRRWSLLGEAQILGQHGNLSHPTYALNGQLNGYHVASYVLGFHLEPAYTIRPRAATSPFVIGGAGFDHLGIHEYCPSSLGAIVELCDSATQDPFQTDVASVNTLGLDFGAGIRHLLYDSRTTELFIEGRYHIVLSGSSEVGRVAFLPIDVGIRW